MCYIWFTSFPKGLKISCLDQIPIPRASRVHLFADKILNLIYFYFILFFFYFIFRQYRLLVALLHTKYSIFQIRDCPYYFQSSSLLLYMSNQFIQSKKFSSLLQCPCLLEFPGVWHFGLVIVLPTSFTVVIRTCLRFYLTSLNEILYLFAVIFLIFGLFNILLVQLIKNQHQTLTLNILLQALFLLLVIL